MQQGCIMRLDKGCGILFQDFSASADFGAGSGTYRFLP